MVSVSFAGESFQMQSEQPIALHFLRDDGRREIIKLPHHTLAQARSMVGSIFRMSDGLYTEVGICIESGHVETLYNIYATTTDLARI